MAVSANHNLGGRVIQLRSHLSDTVQKIIGGFQGYSPFPLLPSLSTIVDIHIKPIGPGFFNF